MSAADSIGPTFPVAPAELDLDIRRRRVYWVVPICPLCGALHRHGAGGWGANSKLYLGHRQGHCHQPNSGYILVDGNPTDTARVLARGMR